MTLWWIERVRGGKWENVVEASAQGEFCEGYMSAVHELQPSDAYWLCRSTTDDVREVVDEYVPPETGSDPSNGEWRPGQQCKTNAGQDCWILDVYDDGRVSWAYRSLDGQAWYTSTTKPTGHANHPAPPVRHVVQRYGVGKDDAVMRTTDVAGVLVRWTIRGGKIVEAEVLEGVQ